VQEIFGLTGALATAREATLATFDESFVAKLAAALGDAMYLNGHAPEGAIAAVIDARNAARAQRDFARADQLRRALTAVRIVLTDNKDGTTTWSIE